MKNVSKNRIAAGFAEVLKAQGFSFLERSPDPSFALDSSVRLAYVNPSYLTFGSANGGLSRPDTFSGIGTFIGDFMSDPLRQFYLTAYNTIMGNNRAWDHEYDCSSATLYRRYLQSTFPLQGEGLVVVNRLVDERAHTTESAPPVKEHYLNEKQLVPQCAHCHKVRRHGADLTWDWVSEWVADPPEEVTHSLCEHCTEYYYEKLQPTLNPS